jgi:hypothetical protein
MQGRSGLLVYVHGQQVGGIPTGSIEVGWVRDVLHRFGNEHHFHLYWVDDGISLCFSGCNHDRIEHFQLMRWFFNAYRQPEMYYDASRSRTRHQGDIRCIYID